MYVAGRITYNVYKNGEGVLKEATSIVADDVIPFTWDVQEKDPYFHSVNWTPATSHFTEGCVSGLSAAEPEHKYEL